MTLEELKAEMRKNAEKQQNQFIDKLVEQIEFLCEEANRKDYVPTDCEREQFAKIVAIVTDMNNWF